jgi:hypothetical protein
MRATFFLLIAGSCQAELDGGAARADGGITLGNFTGWSHWTREGTFSIIPTILAASRFYELRLDDNLLGTYVHFWTAAESISKGDHDKTIGVSGASLNVPPNLVDWNGLR